MKQLTVIMPFLNEGEEPLRTVESLYAACSPEDVAVLAISDGGDEPLPDFSAYPGVTALRNERRVGVDASRDIGVAMACTPFVLVIDAHMRFRADDWLQRLLAALRANPTTLFCTTCLSIGYRKEKQPDGTVLDVWHDIDNPTARYQGATLLVTNDCADPLHRQPDGTPKVGMEVLEPKWLKEAATGCVDIPCVLGANYACSRHWWRHIRGVHGLLGWGSSEPCLSLKTWMAGGSCRLLPDIEIAHVFRDTAPYATPVWCILYNKMLLLDLLFPEEVARPLRAALRGSYPESLWADVDAFRQSVKQFILSEREILARDVFKRDVREVLDQFSIRYPTA